METIEKPQYHKPELDAYVQEESQKIEQQFTGTAEPRDERTEHKIKEQHRSPCFDNP